MASVSEVAEALRSTLHVADQALDLLEERGDDAQDVVQHAMHALERLREQADQVRSRAVPLLDRVTSQAEAAARRGMEAVRDTSLQLRDRALQGQETLDGFEGVRRIREEAEGGSSARSESTERTALPETYSDFVEFLKEPGAAVPLLSPKRFSEAVNIDLQTLAEQAHVHRNTVTRAPSSKVLQDFLREALRVIKAATDLTGDLRRALFWYRMEPLSVFGYKTPERLVADGRADDLLSYVASLEAGAAG